MLQRPYQKRTVTVSWSIFDHEGLRPAKKSNNSYVNDDDNDGDDNDDEKDSSNIDSDDADDNDHDIYQ